eukprot:scaffold48_cov311-Pinguiococcus_pyrenoidosus.AAC.67
MNLLTPRSAGAKMPTHLTGLEEVLAGAPTSHQRVELLVAARKVDPAEVRAEGIPAVRILVEAPRGPAPLWRCSSQDRFGGQTV